VSDGIVSEGDLNPGRRPQGVFVRFKSARTNAIFYTFFEV
jgi:hypothetical protein